jgi:hypothetical protein
MKGTNYESNNYVIISVSSSNLFQAHKIYGIFSDRGTKICIFFSFGSTALFRPWPTPWNFSVSLQLLDLGQSVGLLGLVISSSRGLYLYTFTEKRTHKTSLNIHALSGIRTNGRGVSASEDSSRLRLLGYRDGKISHTKLKKKTKLRGFSPQANYTDRATAACRRS